MRDWEISREIVENSLTKDMELLSYSDKDVRIKKGRYTLSIGVGKSTDWRNQPIDVYKVKVTNDKGEVIDDINSYGYYAFTCDSLRRAIASLKGYPTIKEENENGRNATMSELQDRFIDGRWLSGKSGQIKDYWHRPCVIGYAGMKDVVVGIYKTQRKMYKGFVMSSFTDNKIYTIEVSEAVEKMQQLINGVHHKQEIPKQEQAVMTAKMIASE
jgi:hypothetical protein